LSSEEAVSIATTETVSGAHTAIVKVEVDGKMSLTLDDKIVATSKAPGLIKTMPVDGIEVGRMSPGRSDLILKKIISMARLSRRTSSSTNLANILRSGWA
jgi:hypothetical protein